MKQNEVYEQWKQQRASLQPRSEFSKNVISQIGEKSLPARPSFARSILTVAAVMAASVIGLLRIAMTLFLGIHAQ